MNKKRSVPTEGTTPGRCGSWRWIEVRWKGLPILLEFRSGNVPVDLRAVLFDTNPADFMRIWERQMVQCGADFGALHQKMHHTVTVF